MEDTDRKNRRSVATTDSDLHDTVEAPVDEATGAD